MSTDKKTLAFIGWLALLAIALWTDKPAQKQRRAQTPLLCDTLPGKPQPDTLCPVEYPPSPCDTVPADSCKGRLPSILNTNDYIIRNILIEKE